MKKKLKKKKRNPNDTTFRNINALKKSVSHLEGVLGALMLTMKYTMESFSNSLSVIPYGKKKK